MCSSLREELDLVRKDNRRLQSELDERKVDGDRFKALQSHSTHQQMLLHQLRNRLEQYEYVINITITCLVLRSIHVVVISGYGTSQLHFAAAAGSESELYGM